MQYIKQSEYYTDSIKSKTWPRVSKTLNRVTTQLNQSSTALEIRAISNSMQKIYGLCISYLTPAMLLTFGATRLSYVWDVPESIQSYTDTWMASRLFIPSVGMLLALPYMLKNRVSQGLSSTAAAYSDITGLQRIWKMTRVSFQYDHFLRTRLARAAQCLRIMQTLSAIIPKIIQKNLVFFKHMHRLFHDLPKMNHELHELIELMNSETFNFNETDLTSTSFFFRRGRVLCAYRLFDRVKNLFEPAIAAVGELDAYLTIAKLMKEPHKHAHYCFPTYLPHQTQPSIALDSFWNSFLNPKTVVQNSIHLGPQGGIPHMVVTGPNSGGKSTIVCKGIPLAVIMAQSLGIAPAHAMTLTPFTHIAVYMNIADSIIEKESRFQREGKQAFAHGDHIQKLSERGASSMKFLAELPRKRGLIGAMRLPRVLPNIPIA